MDTNLFEVKQKDKNFYDKSSIKVNQHDNGSLLSYGNKKRTNSQFSFTKNVSSQSTLHSLDTAYKRHRSSPNEGKKYFFMIQKYIL